MQLNLKIYVMRIQIPSWLWLPYMLVKEQIHFRSLGTLGTFAQLHKATISFIMSIHLSVCLSVRIEQPGSHWMDYIHTYVFISLIQSLHQLHLNMKHVNKYQTTQNKMKNTYKKKTHRKKNTHTKSQE
jgi:hypothetical protein